MTDELNYLLRRPRFPILVDVGTKLIWCRNNSHAISRIRKSVFDSDAPHHVIDVSGEGFDIYPGALTITPLTFKKRWSKKELIALYNEHSGGTKIEYSDSKLSNRRYEKLFNEIIELLDDNS